jgi:GT2 family glycosyltransferase
MDGGVGSGHMRVEAAPEPISAVICTCDRPDMVGSAVESLLAQEYAAFEVLVVDQSRDDDTEHVVLRMASGRPRLRYMRLSERGLSKAYNRAIQEARYGLLAFTDDDCVAPRDWLQQIASAFAVDREVGLVYGQVLEPSGADPGSLIPTLPVHRKERLSRKDGFRVFGMGANFAARRSRLVSLGGFDEVLGGGGPLQSAQDFDLTYRLCRAGGAILLEPSIVVRHYGSRTPAEWPDTVRSYGVGVGGFYVKHVRSGDAYAAYLLAKVVVKELARVIKRLLQGQPSADHRNFLANLFHGMRRSFGFDVDRRLRLYRLPAPRASGGSPDRT